jgi:hypothetical protein
MTSRRWIVRLEAIVVSVLAAAYASAQSNGVTVEVATGRPLAEAITKVQELSNVPISYEDIPYAYSGDMRDITSEVVNPLHKTAPGQPPPKVLVPRGGQLTASILVDSATGKLTDVLSVTSALDSLLVAYRSAGLPGNFELESYNGVLLVKPSAMRDANGATVQAKPVLSTPITLSKQDGRIAFETLKAILGQVSSVSGFTVHMGMVPMNGLAMSRAAVEAQNERADHVIVRFMAALAGTPNPAASGMYFRFFCDLNSCALNIERTPTAPTQAPSTPYQPPVRSNSGTIPGGRPKTSN